jgi:hypothetical protein
MSAASRGTVRTGSIPVCTGFRPLQSAVSQAAHFMEGWARRCRANSVAASAPCRVVFTEALGHSV